MRRFLIFILAVSFICVGCSKEELPAEEVIWNDNDPTYLRWLVKEDTGNTAIEYEDKSTESYQRRYSGNIAIDEEGPLKTIYLSSGAFDNIEDLEVAVTPTMDRVRSYIEPYSLFSNLEINILSNGIQIGGLSEDKHQSYSVNFYLDGKVHTVYHADWGNYTKDVKTPEELVEEFKTYCGIDVNTGDLLKLFNEIMNIAQTDGVYEMFVSDKWNYNYIALSVKDFGTSAEHWEAYASVVNTD